MDGMVDISETIFRSKDATSFKATFDKKKGCLFEAAFSYNVIKD